MGAFALSLEARYARVERCMHLNGGVRRVLRPTMHGRRCSRVQHIVRCNTWEEAYGLPENGFDKETASMVLRLLTVRAVQQVVVQLQEFNQLQAQYINNFAAENSASDGNKFLLKLIAQPGQEVMDPVTRSVHVIDPQTLAHRILQVRGELANSVASNLASYASQENTAVMRTHLSASLTSSYD